MTTHRSPRITAAQGATAIVLSRGVEEPSEVDRATLELLAGRGHAPIGGHAPFDLSRSGDGV